MMCHNGSLSERVDPFIGGDYGDMWDSTTQKWIVIIVVRILQIFGGSALASAAECFCGKIQIHQKLYSLYSL